jgi:amino acid adenylation domain-containing protein
VADLVLGDDGNGLPQVMFVLHGEHEWIEGEAFSTNAPPGSGYAKTPLSVHITEQGDTVRVTLAYDTGRFNEETVQSILGRFVSVARQVLADPDILIQDIDILLPGERERIMELSGRDNVVPYPDTTLHDIFRETAGRYPDRPAVIEADGRRTTYQELQCQVGHIAGFLRSKGVGPDVVVAILMQRSPELVAAMFGILEAGGAFLLLEPSLPMDRLLMMVEQAGVAVIVSGDEMTELPIYEDITFPFREIMSVDSPGDKQVRRDSSRDSLAYVVFTSGSTGIPKGAMVEHMNVLNRLFYTRDAMGLSQYDRFLQKTPLSFDVSLVELMLPMVIGGAVVLSAPGGDVVSVHEMAELTERHGVTYLPMPPSILKGFLEVPGIQRLRGILRIVNCGGESPSASVMNECFVKLGVRVNNVYGPAETALSVTVWEYHEGSGYRIPPIGRPNANVDVLIMDRDGRPIPPGMSGELWIGGAQTGRGYINNEEETLKRFVDDPLEPGSGRRYYRTGDVARFLPDGNLLFLGRMDDQLKVRGVRIELGDVASALLRCGGVKEAVVLAEPDGEGSNRLRAWVTLKEESVVNEGDIRAAMSELLPGYMVPFRIHVIDEMPLTPHGKTDHRALRAIADGDAYNSEGLPLETPTEKKLAEIWSRLLGVEVKSRDADFFRLGGHSLTAMRLAGIVNREFNVILPLPEFYADGRLSCLAERIDTELTKKAERSSRSGEAYWTFRIWKREDPLKVYSFFNGYRSVIRMAEVCRWDWSVVELTDPQVQKGQIPDLPVEAIAPVYAEAILAEHEEGPIVLMGNCINGIDAYATACHLQERTNLPIHVLLFDTHCPTAADQRQLSPPTGIEGLFSNVVNRLAGKGLRGSGIAIRVLRRIFRVALAYRFFDPEWYLKRYPDVAQAGIDPLSHYLALGWKENRHPSLSFNASLYQSVCPNFQRGLQNPVLHHLLVGRRSASVRRAVREFHSSPEEIERIMASGWFDADWYKREYPGVACHGRSPLAHYMSIGWRFERKPYPGYDPDGFAGRFPGFVPGKDNPLRHILSLPEIPQRIAHEPESTESHGEKPAKALPHHNPEDDMAFVMAQSRIRSGYRPGVFKGEVHFFSNQILHDRNPTNGWRTGPHGNVRSIRMNGDHDSYLVDDIKTNAWKVDKVIRDILYPRRPEW